RPIMPVYEEHLAKFSELFASGQPVIITPFKPKRPPNAGFRAGSREARDGKSGRWSGTSPPPREKGTSDFPPGDRPPPSEAARMRLRRRGHRPTSSPMLSPAEAEWTRHLHAIIAAFR